MKIEEIGERLGYALLVLTVGIAFAIPVTMEDDYTRNDFIVDAKEFAQVNNEPCPEILPPNSRGNTAPLAPAIVNPEMHQVQKAWICRYDLEEGEAEGSGYNWVRNIAAQPVREEAIEDLNRKVQNIRVRRNNSLGNCPDDLGPRWLISYTYKGDLTGVVVDGYSCNEIRLTDNPHTTPRGTSPQIGTVGGVFGGGANLLEFIEDEYAITDDNGSTD